MRLIKPFFFLIFFLISNNFSFAQFNQWAIRSRLITDNLAALHFQNSSTGFAVGQTTTDLFRTTDGGETWALAGRIGNAGYNYLFDMTFINATTGIASLEFSGLWKTTNAGVNWTNILNSAAGFHSPTFASENLGYTISYGVGVANIMKTTNGGVSWSQVYSFYSGWSGLYGLKCTDANNLYACADTDTLYKSTDGGVSWGVTRLPQMGFITSMYFLNTNTGYVINKPPSGNGLINKTTNGGLNWYTVYNVPYVLNKIAFMDQNTGFAAGGYNMLITTDAGVNWNVHPTGTNTIFFDIAFTDVNTLFMSGSNGRIIKTTNGGLNWTDKTSLPFVNFNGVSYPGVTTLFVGGDGGNIFRTTDIGATWLQLNFPVTQNISSLSFTDTLTGYAATKTVNGQIYKTINSGINWQLNYTASQPINFIKFVNQSTGIAVCDNGKILNTTNGAVSWTEQSAGSQNFSGISFRDINNVFAVGSGGVIYTSSNSGISWNTVSSPTSNNLASVYFTSSVTGYAAGVNVILKTTNSGTSWSVLGGIPNNNYHSVWFRNSDSVFVSGDNGVILSTINSGASWSNQVTNVTKRLNCIANSGMWTFAVGDSGNVIYRYFGPPIVGINGNTGILPSDFQLYQNYPNPFNPSTRINIDIPKESFVELKIFDALGGLVRVLNSSILKAGTYTFKWNAMANSSGIYFYVLKAGDFTQAKKMVLLK